MTTISMTAPKNAKEIKNLAWAQKTIKATEAEIANVAAQDNTKDDFNPSEGTVALADYSIGRRTMVSGTVDVHSESGTLKSATLEKTRPVEVEIDHMMWGTYQGVTSIAVEKSEAKSTYKFHDQVSNKITRDYEIVVDHQNQTLSFDFQQEKGPWVGGFRGL